MNEITRKAANALVATVDFFQGALATEAQTGDAKQAQIEALAGQLKAQASAQVDTCNALEDADKEVARLRELLEAEQTARRETVAAWDYLRIENGDLKSRLSLLEADRNNLTQTKPLEDRGVLTPNEARNVLNVLARVKALISFRPRTKSFQQALVLLTRDMKALDGIKTDP